MTSMFGSISLETPLGRIGRCLAKGTGPGTDKLVDDGVAIGHSVFNDILT